jgi:hypothetical protein
MKRVFNLGLAALLMFAVLVVTPACQRTVEVQTGTRTVDSQGHVISEDIRTVRVPADKASAYRVVTIKQPASNADTFASLYAEAQKAIEGGNLKLAETKLTELLGLTADYQMAKSQLDAIKKGQKVSADPKATKPGTTTSPGGTSDAPGQPVEVAGSLLQWVPDTLSGFTAAKTSADALSVSREYKPGSGNAAASLVIIAEQFRTAADAKSALAIQAKRPYPKNAATSKVHGHDVYFGTDGKRFAVMGFTSGAVMVAVEASPESGSPSGLSAALAKVVSQLP